MPKASVCNRNQIDPCRCLFASDSVPVRLVFDPSFSLSRGIPGRPAAYNGLPDDPAIPADQPEAHPLRPH